MGAEHLYYCDVDSGHGEWTGRSGEHLFWSTEEIIIPHPDTSMVLNKYEGGRFIFMNILRILFILDLAEG